MCALISGQLSKGMSGIGGRLVGNGVGWEGCEVAKINMTTLFRVPVSPRSGPNRLIGSKRCLIRTSH